MQLRRLHTNLLSRLGGVRWKVLLLEPGEAVLGGGGVEVRGLGGHLASVTTQEIHDYLAMHVSSINKS